MLLAIERLQAYSYGMQLRREIGWRTGRSISIGAVYVTLMRMEAKGWVRSVPRPRNMTDCSRARRFYIVEAPGRCALRLALRDSDMLREGLPALGERQPRPEGFLPGLRLMRRQFPGPWPEEPSVVKRSRTPRDPHPHGRWGPRRDYVGPWAPWVRWWLLGLMDRVPASS